MSITHQMYYIKESQDNLEILLDPVWSYVVNKEEFT